MKFCQRCETVKPATEFWRDRGRPDGLQVYCKSCLGRINQERARANPQKVWAFGIKFRYGITAEDFDRILREQGGVCGACGGPPFGTGRTFHIDHDHVTGKVRGLLCQNCNVALGGARDDPENLRKLIAYLERHGVSSVTRAEPVAELQMPSMIPT